MSAVQEAPVAPSQIPRVAAEPLVEPVVNPALSQALATKTERLPFLDLLRAISAHVIVWHHLVFYGPLADVAAPLWLGIHEFLAEHGPNAVQVFLVIGGFVTGQSLDKRKQLDLKDALGIVKKRYVRIAGPYIAVLLIAVIANLLAEQWMEHHSISEFPTIPQFLAHTVFLHDILGYQALSAGVWYLAIDFQLGLLLVAIWWLAHRASEGKQISPLAVAQIFLWPLAVASLFWFNRDPDWNMWALFFLGSYTFGLVISWTLSRRLPAWCFWLYAALLVTALVVEFRPRLAVSLSTGLLIFAAGSAGWLATIPKSRWLTFAGASSYSLFLIHFPICLVVNAVLWNFVSDSPILCLIGMFAAYGLSLLAATAFYHGVERRFQRERTVLPAAVP